MDPVTGGFARHMNGALAEHMHRPDLGAPHGGSWCSAFEDRLQRARRILTHFRQG
jgi:hypothetical protein